MKARPKTSKEPKAKAKPKVTSKKKGGKKVKSKAKSKKTLALKSSSTRLTKSINLLLSVQNTSNLGLAPNTKAAADTLLATHPQVVFTSGRRSVPEQASAMAVNVVQNRKWIEQTYAASHERTVLQTWVNDNPQATTKPDIAAGLEGLMTGWTDAQKRNISWHFSGQAFDIQPISSAYGLKVIATIKALPNLRKFMEKEGGLDRWHAEFVEA